MLDPYHKPMESVGECDHANDHIADVEAKLAAAEARVKELEGYVAGNARREHVMRQDLQTAREIRDQAIADCNEVSKQLAAAEAALERQKELTVWAQDEKAAAEERVVELEEENERLREMADCPHYSATGIDMTPLDDPGKVWRCDGCGFEYREEHDAEHLSYIRIPVWRARLTAPEPKS